VAKVEALIQTVDLLGTKRYNAINKWETLMHTTISTLRFSGTECWSLMFFGLNTQQNCMEGMKLEAYRCLILEPKNRRVLQVTKVGNIEPGDRFL